ncbi:RluA family pseudouridine synthase [Campylobacter sp. FMV-PI01]|uniref:RNA pseudouridylate synthase n=1 Tax=Campylobacter portucalensis TaxID=2608384 RepID=A0A6L5WIE6_9BACT|nr:RluA family pseudouridine synthase [Campylobacter portucalensis]MSN96990.1 RluA family pseudouridine synthase [Campylobacter portucalensis]
MAYIERKILNSNGKKAYQILLDLGYSMSQAQRLIDKKRLINLEKVVENKNQILQGEVFLIDYECKPKNLEPIFEDENFAAFDKPSGVLTHPNGRNCNYSMNDEIWSKFGKNASVAHRLDKETSGVLLVTKNKEIEKAIKLKFQNLEVKKCYFAMVRGVIRENFEVIVPLDVDKNSQILKNKIYVKEGGKFAKTKFKVEFIYENLNATLLKCFPQTGRQHQIRVHLFHVKHPIIGDPLYGVSDEFACDFLDGKISDKDRLLVTGSKRLMLHSSYLKFAFQNKDYLIQSKLDIENEFLKFTL